jgi:hypothetical protein
MLSSLSAALLPKSARSEDNASAPSPRSSTDSPKPKQLSAAQQLEHVVILLRTEDDQNRQFSGTGFLFNFFRSGDQSVTTIVTNRHVVAGMTKMQMRWTRKTPSNEPDFGNFVDTVLENLQERIIVHPDPSVDLAIISVSDVLNKYQNESKPLYTVGVDQALISSETDLKKFQPLEDILIVGYPDGVSEVVPGFGTRG